jgi:uncharacterized membrane protein
MAQTHLAPPPARWGIRFTTRDITITGILGAIAALLGLVPGLGFIPAPTPAGAATTMHIPAIIAGILEGPVVGALVGAIFGVFSFSRDTTGIFRNPLIAFGPRILIGVVAFLVFRAVLGRFARGVAAAAIGAGLYTIFGPGARQFEAAYADGKIKPSWLIDAYHQVAAVTSPAVWVAIVLGLAGSALAYLLLRGENAAPAAAATRYPAIAAPIDAVQPSRTASSITRSGLAADHGAGSQAVPANTPASITQWTKLRVKSDAKRPPSHAPQVPTAVATATVTVAGGAMAASAAPRSEAARAASGRATATRYRAYTALDWILPRATVPGEND